MLLKNEHENITIELKPETNDKTIAETIKSTNARVYQDRYYRVFLLCDKISSIETLSFGINDDVISYAIERNSGEIITNRKGFETLFYMSYGYVQLHVAITINNECYSFESSYIPVMVKKSIQNYSVQRMTKYIYQNNSVLLSNQTDTPKDKEDFEENYSKTIETKIILLRKILNVLEENYSYFKINSRYITEHVEKVDYFDKLQYVSASTIQYIAQHPNELRRTNSNTGIVINGHRYQPERTLITQNSISYDTIENRAIVGFIDQLHFDIVTLKKEIQELIQKCDYDSFEEGDYISSTYYVYVNTVEVLAKMKDLISQFEQRVLAIQMGYRSIYRFKAERVNSLPNPTAIFMSAPQYRQIYDCMFEWFKHSHIGLQTYNQILGLKKMNDIYEMYVLLKLIKYFNDIGYTLNDCSTNVYTFNRRSLYKNTKFNNYFHFTKGNDSVTLYYQPVVYCNNNSLKYGIGLYRNNTHTANDYSFASDDNSRGYYYTPDYIIKHENPSEDHSQYLILDAKYSDQKSVLKYQISTLAFKYLFSISAINPKDQIVGLYIINGQSSSGDSLTDVYNKKFENQVITPRAEIITLTENEENSNDSHLSLFNNSMGKFF